MTQDNTRYDRQILNLIYKRRPISRSQIHKVTGIRFATITSITKEMIADGIVREGGSLAENEKSKKKVLLFNDDRYLMIGVDIQSTIITAILANMGGKVLRQIDRPMPSNAGGSQIIAEIIAAVRDVIGVGRPDQFLGIGISCPAVLDKGKGAIRLSSQISNLNNINLKKVMEDEFRMPAFLEASNHLKLLCEKWFGCVQDSDDVLYVEMGRGIAASMITDGHFIKGYFGIEGELGHTIVEPNGRICMCGNRGCLETVASTDIIVKNVKDILESGSSSIIRNAVEDDLGKISIGTIIQAAEAGDKIAANVLNDAARYIGLSISNIVNVIGPQVIVFGGELVSQSDYMTDSIIRKVRSSTMAAFNHELIFKVSEIKQLQGALGAVALILTHFFEPVPA